MDEPGTVALLYADFPKLGERWERDAERTGAIVRQAHKHFDTVVASHGGVPIPAMVDARCARFGGAGEAIAAAIAYRRVVMSGGGLPIRLAVWTGTLHPDGALPVPLFNRARELALSIAAGEIAIPSALASAVDARLAPALRLRRSTRCLCALGINASIILLEDRQLQTTGRFDSGIERIRGAIERRRRRCPVLAAIL
jgi:hypothetical protein